MNAVIEITHYGANVTYVREATVSPWLAGPISRQPSAGGMLRGSWVSLAVAAAPIELARSDGQSGGYSEPEVSFWEVLPLPIQGFFLDGQYGSSFVRSDHAVTRLADHTPSPIHSSIH
jgi:hypothetical protein